MATKNNNRVFTLYDEPVEFIAGDSVPLRYEVGQDGGGLVNLGMAGTKIVWVLAPYDDPGTAVLQKTSADSSQISVSAENINQFTVYLQPEDTANLEKMYIYQITITSPVGTVAKRMQGYIVVWPQIPY